MKFLSGFIEVRRTLLPYLNVLFYFNSFMHYISLVCSGWWKYDQRTTKEIEAAYLKEEPTCQVVVVGMVFIIDFSRMLQFRIRDPTKRRRIKRDLSTIPVKGIAGISIKRLDGENDDEANDLEPLLAVPPATSAHRLVFTRTHAAGRQPNRSDITSVQGGSNDGLDSSHFSSVDHNYSRSIDAPDFAVRQRATHRPRILPRPVLPSVNNGNNLPPHAIPALDMRLEQHRTGDINACSRVTINYHAPNPAAEAPEPVGTVPDSDQSDGLEDYTNELERFDLSTPISLHCNASSRRDIAGGFTHQQLCTQTIPSSNVRVSSVDDHWDHSQLSVYRQRCCHVHPCCRHMTSSHCCCRPLFSHAANLTAAPGAAASSVSHRQDHSDAGMPATEQNLRFESSSEGSIGACNHGHCCNSSGGGCQSASDCIDCIGGVEVCSNTTGVAVDGARVAHCHCCCSSPTSGNN